MKKYIHVIYGLVGGILWGIYTLFINRYYQTNIFQTYWRIDNVKELFSEAIVNNIICVVASFGFGLMIWVFKWKKRISNFVIRNKKHILIVIVNGLLSGTAATVLYHLAVQFSGEVFASAIKTLYIPLSSVYSWLVYKKANWKSFIGVILATASIIGIGFLDSGHEHVQNLVIGLIGSSLVGVCWTAEAIFTAKVLHHDNTDEKLEASVFISYRQLVSLIGVVIAAYILYPIITHTLIKSNLNEGVFSWDWVMKIGFDWNSIWWLVIGSAFNSISDFYYYWSYEGLSIPTATTMNNLDTPLGFIYVLLIIVTGGSVFFGTQSVPSYWGIALIFLLLIGSLLVIFYDDNDFLHTKEERSKYKINPNKMFWRYTVILFVIFGMCTFFAHGPGVNLEKWKQTEPPLSKVDVQTVKKYEPKMTIKKAKEIVNLIEKEDNK